MFNTIKEAIIVTKKDEITFFNHQAEKLFQRFQKNGIFFQKVILVNLQEEKNRVESYFDKKLFYPF